VAGIELMRRAGAAVLDELLHRWPRAARLSICCGKGNNAGDGYVIARLAAERGLGVELVQLGDPGALSGDAAISRDAALAAGIQVRVSDDGAAVPGGEVLVDALLGTGLSGAPRGPYAALIATMNASGRPIVAVDVPSGVVADTGAAPGAAVRAALTVTFIGRKVGLVTGAGAALAGRVAFAPLGVGDEVRRQVPALDHLTFAGACARFGLPRRDARAYKQALGHLLVVGGDESMGGAPLMAAEAALRTGVGMVTLITRGQHRPAVLSRRPELMVVDADRGDQVDELLARAAALVVGPGLGRGAWGRALLERTLGAGKPMVLDADALYLLDEVAGNGAPDADVIITPHSGEAARLLGRDSGAVEADRIQAALDLAQRVAGVAVLKGAGSVLARATPGVGPGACLGICAHGNPGMATAGMGDVLAGITGAFRAQGLDPAAAAVLGTCLHGAAADAAARRLGQASLLATDLFTDLAAILKDRERGQDQELEMGADDGPV
jgi:hydroxyethylthiazole kinase-like uncharacterized protein yjeF